MNTRLASFFQGHFHEDWELDDVDADAVVARYVRDTRDGAELERLAEDISAMMQSDQDDSLERRLFEELGCYYDPSADGLSARAWLESVITHLRRAAKAMSN